MSSIDIDPGTAGRRTDGRYRYVDAAPIPRVREGRTVGRFTLAVFQMDCAKEHQKVSVLAYATSEARHLRYLHRAAERCILRNSHNRCGGCRPYEIV